MLNPEIALKDVKAIFKRFKKGDLSQEECLFQIEDAIIERVEGIDEEEQLIS